MSETTIPYISIRARNLESVQRAYARWSETKGQSAADFLDMMADSVEMRSVLSPQLPDDLAADRKTRGEAEEYFAIIARDWEMLDFDVDRFISDSDDIVMVGRCRWRHRATGNEIDSPKVDIWHFNGGKVVKFLEMFDSLAFVRATGAAAALGVA